LRLRSAGPLIAFTLCEKRSPRQAESVTQICAQGFLIKRLFEEAEKIALISLLLEPNELRESLVA
jgi:hypothetical protein